MNERDLHASPGDRTTNGATPGGAVRGAWIPRAVLATVVVLLAPLLLLDTCDFIERPTTHYATLQEAEDDGAMSRGWIPPYLPASTRDIVETHDIDTNEVDIAFQYDPGDLGLLARACTRVGTDMLRFRCADSIEVSLDLSGSGSVRTLPRLRSLR